MTGLAHIQQPFAVGGDTTGLMETICKPPVSTVAAGSGTPVSGTFTSSCAPCRARKDTARRPTATNTWR